MSVKTVPMLTIFVDVFAGIESKYFIHYLMEMHDYISNIFKRNKNILCCSSLLRKLTQ